MSERFDTAVDDATHDVVAAFEFLELPEGDDLSALMVRINDFLTAEMSVYPVGVVTLEMKFLEYAVDHYKHFQAWPVEFYCDGELFEADWCMTMVNRLIPL